MTKFNAEKYERFLEDRNTFSSIGLIENFDERIPEVTRDVFKNRPGNV